MFQHGDTFSSFSVSDLQKAKEFYGKTLELDVKEVSMPEGGSLLEIDGGKVMVYPKADHAPASFTVLNVPVPDVEAAVAELKKRGATFEIYDDGPVRTDARGISHEGPMKMAWLKDPAGNIVSVLQER